jgi:1-acyl-sn-glycerol-3-phosphate acyltransferase
LEKICSIKIEFRGLENIPKGACIIASKHESTLETFALTLHAPDFTFVLKRELLSIPFFGWYLRRAEQLGIDRSKGSQALTNITREASRILAEGRQIFYFPEGTRRAVGAPSAYRSGIAHVYMATGAVCLPVALNSGLFWPRRGLLRRRGTVVIAFLKPIQPGLDKRTFMRLLQQSIETASAELVAEAIANDPSLKANLTPGESLPAI